MSFSAWASQGAADETGGESAAAVEAWAGTAGEIDGGPR